MTKRTDVVHPLLEKLWRRAMADKDLSFKPHSVRIDVEALMLLRNERGPWDDGSMDPYHADGLKAWRKLPFTMEHRRAASFYPAEYSDEAVLMIPRILCIETRQDGESGRRKYYDATDEEMATIKSYLEGADKTAA